MRSLDHLILTGMVGDTP